MNREEKLARALMDVYGGGIDIQWPKGLNPYGYRFCVKFLYNGISFSFRNWHEFLFGSGPADPNENFESANFYLKRFDASFRPIKFSSLDELEIQLTLMGRNPI